MCYMCRVAYTCIREFRRIVLKIIQDIPRPNTLQRGKIQRRRAYTSHKSHSLLSRKKISCGNGQNIDAEIGRFGCICEKISRALSSKPREVATHEILMITPILTYGSGKQNCVTGIQAAEIRFLRKVKGCSRLDTDRSNKSRS